jgi:hypothetical protein
MDEKVKDFLFFRRMLTPLIIQIIFWVGAVVAFVGGIVAMFTTGFLYGLLTAILGPILVRIWTELIIVLFKINDSLSDIRAVKLKESKGTETPVGE